MILGQLCCFLFYLLFYSLHFPEMVVQDDQSIKTSTHICCSGGPKCISSFDHWFQASFQLSNLFQSFFHWFCGFQHLFKVLQHFTIGFHQLALAFISFFLPAGSDRLPFWDDFVTTIFLRVYFFPMIDFSRKRWSRVINL